MQRVSILALWIPLLLGVASAAGATAQRTFVASFGNDANPCSLAMPCRSFGTAIVQTNAGGEVIVLDSAGYGSVTITQSVSIVAPPGVYAGVSVIDALANGVTVTAGAADEVALRGLTIHGLPGNSGVDFVSGAVLRVEDCTIEGFVGSYPASNILMQAAGVLYVKNSFVRDGVRGIFLASGSGLGLGVVENTRIEGNGVGVQTSLTGRLTLRNSIIANSSGGGVEVLEQGALPFEALIENTSIRQNNVGIAVSGQGGSLSVLVDDSSLVRNGIGISADGTGSAVTLRLTNSVVAHNTTGLQSQNGASILTPFTNTIENNGTNGAPTGNYSLK